MKVSGFTFIRNATKFDYPVVEAIKSILPVCDDFVVAVGNSDDNTLDLIQGIDKQKIRIIETVWDDSETMKKGGKVFALETDKAKRRKGFCLGNRQSFQGNRNGFRLGLLHSGR